MKKTLSILFGVFLSVLLIAQQKSYEKSVFVSVTGNQIDIDNLENIYIVAGGTLLKYNDKGILQYTYSDLSDGNISTIDVSDPLKILLFYKDFGKIKYLDNKLTLKKDVISLMGLGYGNSILAASSFESGLWLFDPISNQVIRFNNKLQPVQNSGNLNEIVGKEFYPVFMIESNNLLYITDPHIGILVFDRFATYLKKIPLIGIHDFQIYENKIFFVRKNQIIAYDLDEKQEYQMELPITDDKIISARATKNKLYVLTEKGFSIYIRQ